MGLEEILYLRFANAMLEPVWSRNYLESRADHDGRGLRRRGPRPLLRPGRRAARRRRQPPDAGRRGGARWRRRRAATRRRSRTRRSRSSGPIADADPAHYVRGQYDGYRDDRRRRADSTTETYAALRLEIENWRWAGVPFFIRTGKRLPVDADRAAARLQASAAARLPADDTPARAEPARRQARPDDGHPAASSTRTAPTRTQPGADPRSTWSSPRRAARAPTPYEVLLHAAMVGDSTRFTRQDGVEETWRVMQPLLDAPPPVHPYAPGSWGPAAADDSSRRPRPLARTRGWRHDRRRPRTEPAAERGGAVAVPADRGVRVPLELPHRRAGRARRRDRLALRAALRLAERLRQPARPPGGLLPLRAVRHQPSRRRASTSRGRTCS